MGIIGTFPLEFETSGIGYRGYHHACWYQRDIKISASGQRVLLHFGAVNYHGRPYFYGCGVLRAIGIDNDK